MYIIVTFRHLSLPKTMINDVFKGIYLKVYISKYFSCLQSLNELYSKGNTDEYLRKMEVLYSGLLRVPQVYLRKADDNQSNIELIRSFSAVPANPVSSIYSSHTELLSEIEQLIIDRNAKELNNLSGRINIFLDKLFNTTFYNKRSSKLLRYSAIAAGAFILLYLLAAFYSPLKQKYLEERKQHDMIINQETYKQRTLNDILELKAALQKYNEDNKSYPKSSGGWDAVIAPFGESKKDWIPGLVPKYIKELPSDPRKGNAPMEQYMYKSDGINYKLIAHFPLGMEEIINNHPELVDSIRPSWAMGVWSEGAKGW